MSQKALKYILIYGTIIFTAALVALTANSLSQVVNARTPQVTDQVVAGKKLWQNRNCDDCHTILGIGGYWAPDLTKEADHRNAQFLTAWLTDPAAVKPGTTMPNQHLDATQVQDLVAFLQWVSKIDTNNWPPLSEAQVAAGATSNTSGTSGTSSPAAAQGPLLFQQLGCSACHMINGQGATGPGPDLSHIGSQPYDGLQNTPDFLDKWLQDPQALMPTAIMPAIPMTDAQRNTLVDYLTSLK